MKKFIYWFSTEDGLNKETIKIGETDNIQKRIKQFQSNNLHEIKYNYYETNGKFSDKDFHKYLEDNAIKKFIMNGMKFLYQNLKNF